MHKLPKLAVVFIVCMSRGASADDAQWTAARLWVAGCDDRLWVVAASKGDTGRLPEVRMWQVRRKDQKWEANPKTTRTIKPISANPLRVDADAEALRMLLSNQMTWSYFGDHPAKAGSLWSDYSREQPLAWGGDASKPILWALVRTESLVMKEPPDSSQPTSAKVQPDSDDDEDGIITADDRPDSALRSERLTLLRLRNGFWKPMPVLQEATSGDEFWLAGRDEAAYLFWRLQAGAIQFARYANGEWSSPETLAGTTEIACAWVGATAEGPVFIAGKGNSPGVVRLDVYSRKQEGWSLAGGIREGSEYLSVDPLACGVGVAGGRVAIVRRKDDGTLEFGWGELGTSPLVRFSPLSMRIDQDPIVSKWKEALTTGLVLVMLTFIMFNRREQVNRPAVLPGGFVLAAVHQRFLATLIDMAPAMIMIMPWFLSLVITNDIKAMPDLLNDPEFVRKLLPVQIAFFLLYGLWCLVWELKRGTTPGKRIFRCLVISGDGKEPSTRQILVRNVMRIVTLSMGTTGWIVTLMLLVLFTRNRQRMGDLLANTIVVQSGKLIPSPGDRRSDNDPPSNHS